MASYRALVEVAEPADRLRLGPAIAGDLSDGEEAVLEIMQGLHLRWFHVTPGSFFAGHSIGDLRIRTRTGVSVIAVLRGGSSIPNPSPEEPLKVGDTLVALGTVEQMEALLARIRNTPGNFYINVHTGQFPDGAVRGQLF